MCHAGCLSSAKLRSTDSVNPRAVLSEYAPAIGIYSRHRDRRYWPGTGIGIEDRIIVVETAQLLKECSRRIQKEKIVCVGGKPRT